MKEQIKTLDLSPLRYPGSKRRLVPYLLEILRINGLHPKLLVEPFVGGGSITLNFLYNKIIEKAIIADRDKLIYSFWKILFTSPEYLINFIKTVKVDLDNFYKFKEIAREQEKHDEKELAKACIFLNRTSFSGILTDEVGPLGGKKQKSKYKIYCRFNRVRLIEKIKLISVFNNKVIILPNDWEDTLDFVEKLVKKSKRSYELFFYFDPPFFKKAENLYKFHFDKSEHKEFSKRITSLEYNWVLSYDNVQEVKEMYSDKKQTIHLEMPYSINSHAKRLEKELVITSLALPPIKK